MEITTRTKIEYKLISAKALEWDRQKLLDEIMKIVDDEKQKVKDKYKDLFKQ